jgi:hypothetical protein
MAYTETNMAFDFTCNLWHIYQKGNEDDRSLAGVHNFLQIYVGSTLKYQGPEPWREEKFHIENTQTLGIIVRNLGATATWLLELVHPQYTFVLPMRFQNSHSSVV